MDMGESAAGAEFEPADMLVIEDLNQLRVMASDLRVAIIDQLMPATRSVAEVARSLNMSPAKLYYHFRELELAGLIRMVPSQETSSQQQSYRAVAHYYQLSPTLLHPTGDVGQLGASAGFVVGAVEHTRRELQRAFVERYIERWTEAFAVQRRTARLSLAEAKRFRDRLVALALEFRSLDREDGELTVELEFAVFPRPDQLTTSSRLDDRAARASRPRSRRAPGRRSRRS